MTKRYNSRFNILPFWNAAILYYRGDEVVYNDDIWQCDTDKFTLSIPPKEPSWINITKKLMETLI